MNTQTTPIEKARIRRKLTQVQLAKAAKCSQATISKLEKRNHVAKPELAARLAKVLRLPEIQILYPERYMDKPKRKAS
jgi:transcriptional regulator with XRE-family HTH domain